MDVKVRPGVRLPAVLVGLIVGTAAALFSFAPKAEATQIMVAQCLFEAPCWTGPTQVNWNFTFNPSAFNFLSSGSIPLIVTQTSEFTIELDVATLHLTTTDGPVISMAGPYSGITNYPGPFPSSPNLAGTFTYQIPAGATITGATISGGFGIASENLFTAAGENVCVGLGPCAPPTCVRIGPCGGVSPTPEPSALVYVASVLPGLAALARRRRPRAA
jgi:hypothetical protein